MDVGWNGTIDELVTVIIPSSIAIVLPLVMLSGFVVAVVNVVACVVWPLLPPFSQLNVVFRNEAIRLWCVLGTFVDKGVVPAGTAIVGRGMMRAPRPVSWDFEPRSEEMQPTSVVPSSHPMAKVDVFFLGC